MGRNGKKFGRNGKTKTSAKSSAKLRETPSQASGWRRLSCWPRATSQPHSPRRNSRARAGHFPAVRYLTLRVSDSDMHSLCNNSFDFLIDWDWKDFGMPFEQLSKVPPRHAPLWCPLSLSPPPNCPRRCWTHWLPKFLISRLWGCTVRDPSNVQKKKGHRYLTSQKTSLNDGPDWSPPCKKKIN